ncbi:MAG: hypothetical protein RL618_520 [Pseudomonadota bacterium]|jgi:uncharacterized protein (TIGR02466 family)
MQALWPVPMDVRSWPEAKEINPVLVRALKAMRSMDPAGVSGNFYASADDLIVRMQLPEFASLLNFIAGAVQHVAKQSNVKSWPHGKLMMDMQFVGCWFQIQNGQAFHDVHTHGNCSWSGVYYVQIDPSEQRRQHTSLGELNGVTRFYGPYAQFQAGAYMDMGNAYLQNHSTDIQPEEGMLAIFPSYLPHKAMPYEGEKERIVISFNAQINARSGNRIYSYSGA